MVSNPNITVSNKPSRKKRKAKEIKSCKNCLNSFIPPELNDPDFRCDFIKCYEWKSVVHYSHAKVCPRYEDKRPSRRKRRRR